MGEQGINTMHWLPRDVPSGTINLLSSINLKFRAGAPFPKEERKDEEVPMLSKLMIREHFAISVQREFRQF